ncbi:MAG: thioredoxin family protein [Acidimicrobiales bacterium]|nr:thioredoxin family protein [Acidimicrobiales bacterium]
MDRLLVLTVVAALAGLLAVLLQRWRPGGPVATVWSVPGHLDRSDFAKPDIPWLVAVFSSTDCSSCASMVAEAHTLAAALVTVQEVPAESASELHDRYQVDAVPMLLVADADGLVRGHHLGPSTPGELQAVLEGARSSRSHDKP